MVLCKGESAWRYALLTIPCSSNSIGALGGSAVAAALSSLTALQSLNVRYAGREEIWSRESDLGGLFLSRYCIWRRWGAAEEGTGKHRDVDTCPLLR